MGLMIECAGWHNNSCDDGPGVRSVLFLQECSRNCGGCHNAGINEHGKGTMVPIEDLMVFIESRCCNKKITISGGEPLEQANSLKILIQRLKEKGYNVCVYTGWEIERVPEHILRFVDYIKTGSYAMDLKNSDIQYAGSSNQRMFSVDHGNIRELDIAV